MARVPVLAYEDFPEEVRTCVAEGEVHGSDGVWATRPDLMVPLRALSNALASRAMLDPRLIELVRLRIAFHNQCRSCMARRSERAVRDGLTEALVCQLASPEDGADLTARDRAALHYADLLAANHLAICDETFERLRRHFTNAEIVELGMHCAVFVGFGRLSMSWDLVEDLPARFRDRASPVTPWVDDAQASAAA